MANLAENEEADTLDCKDNRSDQVELGKDSNLDEPYQLTHPFDSRQIDISMEVNNIRSVIDMLEDESIDLNTEFQRSRDLWNDTKMSRLIESLIVRLPIPPFYLAASGKIPADSESKLQVVDGLQRLSSLHKFAVQKKLELTGLDLLPALNGLTYHHLDVATRRAFDRAQVTLYLIRPNTPKQVKYILFGRLNTGGVSLNAQEIRHALNQGIPANFVKELAGLPSFTQLIKLTARRMRDRELVLRFIAFYQTDPVAYKRGFKHFLDDTMESLGELSFNERLEIREKFERSLNVSFLIFGKNAFSRSWDDNSQINAALFECWTVSLAKLNESDLKLLLEKKGKLLNIYRNKLDEDLPFISAITEGTSAAQAVRTRFETISQLILSVLTSPI